MKTINEIIINYFANMNVNKQIKDLQINEQQETQIRQILSENQKDWENLPCDEDGASEEQLTVMDEFLNKIENEINWIINNFKN